MVTLDVAVPPPPGPPPPGAAVVVVVTLTVVVVIVLTVVVEEEATVEVVESRTNVPLLCRIVQSYPTTNTSLLELPQIL